jgi:hypothetical protein
MSTLGEGGPGGEGGSLGGRPTGEGMGGRPPQGPGGPRPPQPGGPGDRPRIPGPGAPGPRVRPPGSENPIDFDLDDLGVGPPPRPTGRPMPGGAGPAGPGAGPRPGMDRPAPLKPTEVPGQPAATNPKPAAPTGPKPDRLPATLPKVIDEDDYRKTGETLGRRVTFNLLVTSRLLCIPAQIGRWVSNAEWADDNPRARGFAKDIRKAAKAEKMTVKSDRRLSNWDKMPRFLSRHMTIAKLEPMRRTNDKVLATSRPGIAVGGIAALAIGYKLFFWGGGDGSEATRQGQITEETAPANQASGDVETPDVEAPTATTAADNGGTLEASEPPVDGEEREPTFEDSTGGFLCFGDVITIEYKDSDAGSILKAWERQTEDDEPDFNYREDIFDGDATQGQRVVDEIEEEFGKDEVPTDCKMAPRQ